MHRWTQGLLQGRTQRECAFPVGQVAGVADVSIFDRARRADTDPLERGHIDLGRGRGIAQRDLHRGSDVGGPAGARRLTARSAADREVLVNDHRLDLGSAEVDTA